MKMHDSAFWDGCEDHAHLGFHTMSRALHNILITRIHDRNLSELASKHLRGRLIDIGCGSKPYKNLLAPYLTEHVGVDVQSTGHDTSEIDIFSNAYDIPVDSNSIDSAICTAVLEHLEEPEQAICECYRVLKPGGAAIYSVPFIWHLHEEPRDFYRFSKYGLEYLFEKVGFEIVELRALSGFWVTFGQLFVYNLYRLNRGPLRWLRIIDAIGLTIQGLAFLLDRIDKSEQWTWMYMVVARKKAEASDEK